MHGVDVCPLCRTSRSSPLEVVSYQRIFQELASQWDVVIPVDIAQAHTPSGEAILVECASCGLQYFAGAVAGNPDFYAELSDSFDYEEDRWEFAEIRRRLTADDRVVDLGTGSGMFLRSIRDAVESCVGVDHNDPAIEQLRAEGIEAHTSSFEEFASLRPRSFSVVTGFHVIEHLSDVSDLVGPAARLLQSGGRLYLSAPNREREEIYHELEPLDFPPHHVSRWGSSQWSEVGRRFGLELVSVSFEPPPVISLERRISQAVRRAGFGWLARAALSLLWHTGATKRLYERRLRADWFAGRGMYGHSMLAEFRPRPDDSRPTGS